MDLKNLQDDQKFEKGLSMLLKHSYHAPQAREAFRADLLRDLKATQHSTTARRKNLRLVWLYSGVFAAAAAVAICFMPLPYLEKTPQTRHVATLRPAAKASLHGAVAFALQPLNVKMPNSQEWRTLAVDEAFSLVPGMEIATPAGAVDNTGFGVRHGPAVMLVGLSKVRVADDGGLKVLDGQAMLDLSRADKSYAIAMNNQQLSLQPGAMVLVSVDNDENYAQGGAPAPTLAILHGHAAVRGLDNEVRKLNSGRIYELYDTGTGIFPNRGLSQSENQQRFLPMIDAIRAANVH